jgi:DNA-binding beta-propeller fold protein YncE
MTLVDPSPPLVDQEAQALIKEARSLQKRRRRWIGGASVTAVLAGAVAYVIVAQVGAPASNPLGSGTLSQPPPSSSSSSSSGGATAYFTSGASIIPFDLATKRASSPIAVPGRITNGIAMAHDGHTAYVTTYEPNRPYRAAVVPIHLATKTAGSPIFVPGGIGAIAITPDGRTAYVTTGAPGAIIPIDLTTGTVGLPISLPSIRPGMAITPDGRTAYVVQDVANGAPSVVPIDLVTKTADHPISVPTGGYGIAITPDGHTAYLVTIVTPRNASSVVPINLVTKTAGRPISVLGAYSGIAITPNGRTAYVTTVGAGIPSFGRVNTGPALVPIDLATKTVGRLISMPDNSGDIAIAPAVAQ